MLRLVLLLSTITLLMMPACYAKQQHLAPKTHPIPIPEMVEYDTSSAKVKDLIINAFHLSKMNLAYLYGSSNPANNGMDCSGTIYYLLKKIHLANPPRQSNEMFNWVQAKGDLHKVSRSHHSYELSQMKPGDLLFWSGTHVTHPKSAITHVMLYLGKNKQGIPLMFGSTNGRKYRGEKMWGVSVFDFTLPRKNSRARFVGYSCIPELNCE